MYLVQNEVIFAPGPVVTAALRADFTATTGLVTNFAREANLTVTAPVADAIALDASLLYSAAADTTALFATLCGSLAIGLKTASARRPPDAIVVITRPPKFTLGIGVIPIVQALTTENPPRTYGIIARALVAAYFTRRGNVKRATTC